jgi:hypothetical protein
MAMARASNGFEVLARFGYAARGAVYLLIACLALFSSFGGGAQASSEGALTSLLGQPFGRILLAAMAVGLLGFALWRLAQSLLNADRMKHDLAHAVDRAGKFVSAIAYLLLAFLAAGLALGTGGTGGGGSSQEGLAASLMGAPFGRLLVGAAGLAVILAGGAQIWKGFSGKFKERLRLPPSREKWLAPICTYGLAARGLVFAVLGGFLVYAALTVNPENARSIPEALDWVRGLPFGGILYGVVAVGLIAFAAYCVVLAFYRHVDAPSAGRIKQAIPGV